MHGERDRFSNCMAAIIEISNKTVFSLFVSSLPCMPHQKHVDPTSLPHKEHIAPLAGKVVFDLSSSDEGYMIDKNEDADKGGDACKEEEENDKRNAQANSAVVENKARNDNSTQ